ncbi:rab-GTPase-TBC domain-containing protein [Pisolithus thermaeus]|nr:rab-GTPase-TBC domain-containing protein [Pisolithus thermaeus]
MESTRTAQADDALWDSDDQDETPEFNQVTVRRDAEHLRRAMLQGDHPDATASSIASELDASVSTLDLNDGTSHPGIVLGSPSPQFHTPIDPPSLVVEPGSSHEVDSNPSSNGDAQRASSEHFDEKTNAAYPVVHIDVSRPPLARVLVTTEDGGSHPEQLTSKDKEPDCLSTSRSISPESAKPSSPSLVPSPRIVGPSVFQKVVSKTRLHFLPPKSREEDRKHMADWEAMMKESRAAGVELLLSRRLAATLTAPLVLEERRRKGLQQRRIARELNIERLMHIWEKDILPDWRVVHRDPAFRKLWWNGVPTKLRCIMWERAIGNTLALSKDSYRTYLSRARRALSSGVFPSDILQEMEEDIITTLPALHIFHPEGGPLYQELKDMLCAWVISRADEGLSYTRGASRIAAMILINVPTPQAFVTLRNLLERHCLRAFYGGTGTKDDVEAYYRIFDTLLADSMPKIYFNFKQHQISPAAYLPDWLTPLFLDHLPFEACARLWDVILLEGDSFLFRAALAMLAVLESRLSFPDRDELLQLLRGQNKAAIEVAKREGRPLNGGKYEIYGVDEETLWDRIDSMEDWWKESTWRRLTQRELPDL